MAEMAEMAEPPLCDSLVTETSRLQHETVEACRPWLARATEDGLPPLARAKHIAYLKACLGLLPAPYVLADASRPWLLYWALTALYLLGEDVSMYADRVMSTVRPMQNPDGGFGGGHGQISHGAASYAVVLSLITVGGEEAVRMIDRRQLWRWLGQLKQADGGFCLSVGGEEDVRGAYCAMVIISLLALPLALPEHAPAWRRPGDTFVTGLPEYLSRCQTFEGGISGSPETEAHGAYAFCALACLSIIGDPADLFHRFLDLPALIAWLSARQNAPEGGFAGRTNKLVDGCYSHWVGGCWPLVEAALPPSGREGDPADLFSREGLVRYILSCCQAERGGLRDKPTKRPDTYHSCYVLAGLSAAQHRCHLAVRSAPEADDDDDRHLPDAFRWTVVPAPAEDSRSSDQLAPLHPVFVIPPSAVDRVRRYFAGGSTAMGRGSGRRRMAMR
ncbi:MAG: CAAX farnesyltransferase (FTase) subunit beta [Phylliscum demangeonii]|nr:MAG: CAAX farnesyltransferase (FTase) subunit beta [Phylliscum demangeonii]